MGDQGQGALAVRETMEEKLPSSLGLGTSRSRSFVVAMAVMLVVLACASIAVVVGIYDGRESRTLARAPRDVEFHPREVPEFGYALRPDHVGGRQSWTIYLHPYSDSAPLPPGVEAWPRPGEALVSPAVAAAEDQPDSRYGRVVGTIGAEGLASWNELLVYVRPPTGILDPDRLRQGSGFGDDNFAAVTGELLDVIDLYVPIGLIALLWLVPATLLLRAGVHVGATGRRRRISLLETLGYTPRALLTLEARGLAAPFVGGTVAALGVVAAACVVDLPLPGSGYRLMSRDVVATYPIIVGACGLGVVLAMGVAVACSWPRRLRAGTTVQSRQPRYGPVPALMGAALIVWLSAMAVQEATAGSGWAPAWVIVGAVVGAVFFPWICGYLVRSAAVIARAWGNRTGRAGLVIGAGQMSAALRQSARLASLNALAVLLIVQVVVWALTGQIDLVQARATHAAVQGDLVTVAVPDSRRAKEVLPGFIEALPPGTQSLWLIEEFDGVQPTGLLSASDAALHAMGVPTTTDVSLAQLPEAMGVLAGQGGIETLEIVDGAQPPEPRVNEIGRTLVLFDATGAPLHATDVRTLIDSMVSPGWAVSLPGESWLIGGAGMAHQYRWVNWFGVTGAAVLLISLWLGVSENSRRAASQVAPIGALGARPTLFRSVAGVRALIPTGVAIAVGAGSALLFARAAYVMDTGIDPPFATVGLLCAVSVAVGLLAWFLAARAGLKAAYRWRPGQGEP